MTGATRKLAALAAVPEEVPALNGPLVALIGTTASRTLSEIISKSPSVGAALSKARLVVVERPLPIMVMTSPGWPKDGEKLLSVAARPLWQSSSASSAAIICQENQSPLKPNCLSITFANKVPHHCHFNFSGDGMAFFKFPPVNLQAGAPQYLHLRPHPRNRNQGILRAMSEEKALLRGRRRKFPRQPLRLMNVAADSDHARQPMRVARADFNRHQTALREA